MPKIVTMNENEAQKLLRKRLDMCKDDRSSYELRWEDSESIVYRIDQRTPPGLPVDNEDYKGNQVGPDFNDEDLTAGYCFKNLRFIHAQLSANPPSVTVRAATNDQADRQRAQAADRLVRHFIRAYGMQEKFDQLTLNTLIYGSGFLKILWDPHKGDVLDVDRESGEMTLEGDICINTPSPWDIYVDPDANCWEEVNYLFQRIYLSYEEAVYLYPEHAERFKQMQGITHRQFEENRGISDKSWEHIELFEYWEKGQAHNGFLGRYGVMLDDGTIIEALKDNPCTIKTTSSSIEKAILPFYPLTDVDVPNRTWGRSFLEWAAPIQDNLNKMDTAQLANMQAHGKNTMIIPEIAEMEDDAADNSTWTAIKVTGNQPPYYMSPPPVIPQMDTLRAQMKADVDEMCGVNPAMFGMMQRETAGTAMQYATNQGNMIRRRLFNKYVAVTEAAYKALLEIVRQNWDIEKAILVLGNEKSFEAVTIKGADIEGGFDLVVEYGTTLSLDPSTRREEILTLSPLLKEAGIHPRKQLRHLKLNDVEGLHDSVQLAEDRQREIFERMIASGEMIEPRKYQDHVNMIAYALDYFMTKEFDSLDEEHKALLEAHVDLRKQVAAQEQAPPPAPAAAPAPGMPMAGTGQEAPVGPEGALPMLTGQG